MKNILIISHEGNKTAEYIYNKVSDSNTKFGKIRVKNIFAKEFKKYIKNKRVILLNDSFEIDYDKSVKPFIKFIKDNDIVPVFVANKASEEDHVYIMYMVARTFTRDFTDGFLYVDRKNANPDKMVDILKGFVNE